MNTKAKFTILVPLILIGIIFSTNLDGQQLTKAEYFFDIDPGIGNGSEITFTADDTVELLISVSVIELDPGFHKLFIRYKDSDNYWSLYEGRTFYIESSEMISEPNEINAAEYFFDTDPGIGNGSEITISSNDTIEILESISTAELEPGFHKLFVRYKDDNHHWSLYEGRTFYIELAERATPATEIIAAEYFFDEDPGIGNGKELAISSDDTINQVTTLDIAGLASGFHKTFIRIMDDKNKWSLYDGRTFYVEGKSQYHTAAEIVAAEYFIGDDPGIGNGSTLSITSDDTIDQAFNIPTNTLTEDKYWISVRAMDDLGRWSIIATDTFSIVNCQFPGMPKIPVGDVSLCHDPDDKTYVIDSADYATSYVWSITPAEAGTITGTDTIATVNWAVDFSGAAEISVQSINDCSPGPVSDPLVVNVYSYPVAEITGVTEICAGESTELTASGGAEYLWDTDDVSAIITVSPTDDSIFTVEVTENSCTSITEVEVIVNDTFLIKETALLCQGDSILWEDDFYKTAGTTQVAHSSLFGCDSIRELTIEIAPVYETDIEDSICLGETYALGTQSLTEAGNYTEIFESLDGCDSIVNLTLSYKQSFEKDISAEICSGDSYMLGSQTLTESGDYSETFAAVNSCDSIVNLTLNVLPAIESDASAEICEGDSYSFGTQTLIEAGSFTEVFEAANGCDSTVILKLEVNPAYSFTETKELCEGESLDWHGGTYSASGTYLDEQLNAAGCDSTYTLELTVHDKPATPTITLEDRTLTSSALSGNQWHVDDTEIDGAENQTHTAEVEGDYFVLVTNEYSCVSDKSNVINVEFTGISAYENWNIHIYPNPASNKLFIENKDYREIKLEMYDVTGKLVRETLIVNAMEEIDVKAFKASIYILKLTIGEQSRIEKLIIQ